jgi:epoxyqueuosine reductase
MKALLEQIKAVAREEGFDGLGVSSPEVAPEALQFYEQWLMKGFQGEMSYMESHLPLKMNMEALLPGVRSVIAFSLPYFQEPVRPATEGKIARYALGRDYHRVIRKKLGRLVRILEEASPEATHRICVDSAPTLDRVLAHQAGLGWFGKNTLLINSRTGSYFFIGLILTTLDLEPSGAALGGCGSCQKCIDSCPTGAIVRLGDKWAVDSRLCLSYLTIEHRGEFEPEVDLHGWLYGCDVCQEVCPFNQPRETQPNRRPTTTVEEFLQQREFPTLLELASLEEGRWDELTQGSALRRAKAEGLRRNARRVARGTVPDS